MIHSEYNFGHVLGMIANNEKQKYEKVLANMHPADLADLLENLFYPEEWERVLEVLDDELIARVLSEQEGPEKKKTTRLMDNQKLKAVMEQMFSDDLADLLGALSIGRTKELLNLLKKEDATLVQRLLGYDEESAGGIMTTEYIAFREYDTAQGAIEKLREMAPDAKIIYYIYIISGTQKLLGVLSIRDLIVAEPEKKLKEIMTEDPIMVPVDMDQEVVARLMAHYDLLALPVVNKQGQLVGIITVDDVLDVIEEEATEDIYKMAATSELEEQPEGGSVLFGGVKKRLPWLLILLAGDLLSGTVIKNFEMALQSIVALAFFIPVLMDMGGNVGTQSLTVVVRGLATGEIEQKNVFRHYFREVKVGFLIALVCGSLISIIAIFWQGDPFLGIIVGLAMFFTILVAASAGTLLPFLMNWLGADPAVAAGPFITTIIDVSGLFIYFTLATILMEFFH